MSSSMNRATLVGNLGADVEVKQTEKKQAMVTFSVATSEKWKDKESGESVERTEWHKIVAFGKLAELCARFLKKGHRALVEGKLRTRTWDGEDGQKHSATEVVADNVIFLSTTGAAASADETSAEVEPPPAEKPTAKAPAKPSTSAAPKSPGYRAKSA